jgi:hypothetical protein
MNCCFSTEGERKVAQTGSLRCSINDGIGGAEPIAGLPGILDDRFSEATQTASLRYPLRLARCSQRKDSEATLQKF